jgi:hypothetical protein
MQSRYAKIYKELFVLIDGITDGVKPGCRPAIVKPKNPLLMWSGPVSARGVKCKLKEAFGSATEASVEETGKKACKRPDAITTLERCLERVGKACGFCFALRVQNAKAHLPDSCPSMSNRDGDALAAFKRLRAMMHYTDKGGACFRCHIASFGGDILHPEMKRGKVTCTHPNLVLTMATAMHHNRKLQFTWSLKRVNGKLSKALQTGSLLPMLNTNTTPWQCWPTLRLVSRVYIAILITFS